MDGYIELLKQSKKEHQQRENWTSYELCRKVASELPGFAPLLGAIANIGTWEDFSWSSLNDTEIRRLFAFNVILTKLEEKIDNEVNLMIKQKRRRMKASGIKAVDDYEIRVDVSFYLDKDDRGHREDRDNVIARMSFPVVKAGRKLGLLNTRKDWNNIPEYSPPRPLNFRPHCYMFRQLYDNAIPELKFRDLLRIGRIATGIIARDQSYTNLEEFPDYTGKPHAPENRNGSPGG